MRTALSLVACCLAALGLVACGSARETPQAQQGNTYCFSCHSETSALGIKIKWAEAGYATSVHFGGQNERIYAQSLNGGCPPFIQPTAATCTAQGGSHSGAANGNVCTMPPSASATACAAAGGTWVPPEVDVTATTAAGSGPCPTFNQPLAAAGAPQACTVGGGAYNAAAFSCNTAGINTQDGCETAGGVWVGPRFVWTGVEKAGSNAFYANGNGCQVCHTQEGFRKRVAGAYDAPDGSYSLRFSWSPAAFASGTSYTTDTITNPSPLGCFGCHTPHGIGSADGKTLDQTVPVGTPITTQVGSVWGANKAKGHICAECHQVNLFGASSVSASVLGSVTGSGKAFIGSYFGPHHGPQADMVLGTAGAPYSGTASCGAGCTFAFNGSYRNSPHSGIAAADCVACHMQSDYADINVTGTFGVDASVGGHSFTNKGFVHGTEKALPLGCGTVTSGVGCHTVAGVAGSTGNLVKAGVFTRSNGYLQAGEAYFQKSTSPSSMVDSNYHQQVNELLMKLANPTRSCAGLLQDAAALAGGALSWATLFDGVTTDPRCIFNGSTTGLTKAAAPADDNGNASVRTLKALWNFKLVTAEDKSFGVHNTAYALELLYDSCTDLALLTNRPCGSNPGRCSFCEGTYVVARP